MLRAFPRDPTVDAGGRLALHVATDARRFMVRIERWSDGAEIVHEAGPFAGENAPPGPLDARWDWPIIEIALPATLPPGAYVARCIANGGSQARGAPRDHTPDARWGTALCAVRAPSAARVLVYLPLFTYHAYNSAAVDGLSGAGEARCLYTPGDDAVTVMRPGGGTGGHVWDEFNADVYDGSSPRQTFAHWDMYALRWLAREGIAVDVCTDLDLHTGAVDLRRYAMVCSFGHDEYWTREKRRRVEAFVEGGGNVAFFSGNTCWGRICYDPATSVVRRDGKFDDDREDALTGLSWRRGGGRWAGPRPPTGYTIEHADHPLLRDAGLRDGDVLGAAASLVGYEFDGIDPEHAPPGMVVLGRAHIDWDEEGGRLWPQSNAAMVTFRRGEGNVFNAGTTDWARALAWDEPAVSAITRAVFRAFGGLSA